MAIDLRHLRYFAAVAEDGQVSRAARTLYMTQPALSQALRHLELELGVALFVRHPRGVTLTRAGEDVLARARETLAAADSVLAAAAAHQRGRQGELIVGALPETFAFLEQPLLLLRRARPDLRVEVRALDFATQESAVRQREIDIAVVAAPDPDLSTFVLDRRPLVLAMSPSHPLAVKHQISVADLGDAVFPRAHKDVPERWADAFWLTRERGARPRLTDQAAVSASQVLPLIVNGQCVSPSMTYLTDTHTGGFVLARPLVDAEPMSTAFTWTKRTSAVAAFVEVLACARENGQLVAARRSRLVRSALPRTENPFALPQRNEGFRQTLTRWRSGASTQTRTAPALCSRSAWRRQGHAHDGRSCRPLRARRIGH
jgi:DNA-binding transcriptional LysR family regulator